MLRKICTKQYFPCSKYDEQAITVSRMRCDDSSEEKTTEAPENEVSDKVHVVDDEHGVSQKRESVL